jgi:LysM domain-containing protein
MYAYAPLVALALCAVLLAAWPATADAQPTAASETKDARATESVVVAPGDSLWSISARWLGPDATALQVANGVERIYALNRDRIGADPNLLLAGQRLALPSALERRAPEPGSSAGAAREREVGKADQKADQKAGQAPARQAPDAQRPLPALPELARATAVPAAGSLASDERSPSLAEKTVAGRARSAFSTVVAAAGGLLPSGADPERKLLGGALIVVSSALALVLALHVARIMWGPWYAERRAQKRWVREASRTNYAHRPAFDPREDHVVAHAVAHAAIDEDRHARPNGDLQKAAKLALARGLRPHPPSRHSANGGALPGDFRDAAASVGVRSVRRARVLEARRPPLSRAKRAAGGPRPNRARRAPVNRAQRARALRRKGGK